MTEHSLHVKELTDSSPIRKHLSDFGRKKLDNGEFYKEIREVEFSNEHVVYIWSYYNHWIPLFERRGRSKWAWKLYEIL